MEKQLKEESYLFVKDDEEFWNEGIFRWSSWWFFDLLVWILKGIYFSLEEDELKFIQVFRYLFFE